MTAASTRRHKRRVAPGSGQNKRRRAAQNIQSQSTGSTSNSNGGSGPNDLGKQEPGFAENEAPAPVPSLARRGLALTFPLAYSLLHSHSACSLLQRENDCRQHSQTQAPGGTRLGSKQAPQSSTKHTVSKHWQHQQQQRW
ncbi:hypothetical protein GQ54DRAFT_104196 [Martensiomyces pterosporus]|nr:hypothetical protein GQ54DRAFT_104196 [Martensiomyces pterosporus]